MMLAPYAVEAQGSRGRLYPEENSAFRTEFQRDRDRIIHSSAFRRLKYKTQVFVEHEGDQFRTRLSHSIEVAQVARTLGRTLALDVDLTEAVALAHDLGHTPFGHTGEDALNEVMAPYGGFDHNAQAIKIVTLIERHYADFDGLNLTWETLEGIAKHNGPVSGQGAGHQAGTLPYALADYDARHDLMLSTHASAEAQVAAISDDIAYSNHDLEDGLRAGLFSVEAISTLPIIGDAFAEVDRRWPGLDAARRQHEALRRVFGIMVSDVVAESRRLLADSGAASADDIRTLGRPVIRFSGPLFADLKVIRAFFFENMYRHWKVRRMRRKSAEVVKDLFGLFMADPRMLPDDWRRKAVSGDEIRRARVISDYIAGMTDRYALQEHQKITDPMARP